jgi:membrane protein implicated in regulation of membrane protease activity
MAQLIFMVVVVCGGWMLYKRFIRDAEKLSARNRRQEQERKTGAIATLEKDPATGEYRVKREEEE